MHCPIPTDTICPTPKDIRCPTPLILLGGTWYVLCPAIERESRMVQVYFSAVMLLLRQTKAMGGNVERGPSGACLRYTARCGGGWGGAGPMGGVEAGRAQGGGEGRDAMVCMGRGGGDDGRAGSGHGGSGERSPTASQAQGGAFWTHPTGLPPTFPLATIPLSCGTPDLEIFLENVNERMYYHSPTPFCAYE